MEGERERAGAENGEAREYKGGEERRRERTTKLSSTLVPKREKDKERGEVERGEGCKGEEKIERGGKMVT